MKTYKLLSIGGNRGLNYLYVVSTDHDILSLISNEFGKIIPTSEVKFINEHEISAENLKGQGGN